MTTKVSANNFLGKIVTVKMDRPLGTKHPEHGFVYPINYGFIPNTVSGDGEEMKKSFDKIIADVPSIRTHVFSGYGHFVLPELPEILPMIKL